MHPPEFHVLSLPFERNVFPELSNVIEFEAFTKGRMGNQLVEAGKDGIPIVRTTTKYTLPAHHFSPVHHELLTTIHNTLKTDPAAVLPPLHFNHALVEIYNREYSKMGYHSDQCLDLAAGSFIGLFSCYEQPDRLPEKSLRKLKIKDKVTHEEAEILLTHHSVVVFSLETNARYLHKIVLEPALKPSDPDNQWLGMTFRQSKTFIRFTENIPYLSTKAELILADAQQEAEFYKLRAQENNNIHFVYPQLTYTLNPADRMIPKKS